jgi:hypothetical protein
VFAITILPGDYNADGVVDAADYVAWRKTAGQTGAGLAADGNGDRVVDDDDYLIWRRHLGEAVGDSSDALSPSGLDTSVPEPGAIPCLLLVLVGLRASRPRRPYKTIESCATGKGLAD